MKRLLLIPVMVLIVCSALAQSREELYNNFKVALSERDSTAILSLISDWEKIYPLDAELYSLKANYYFQNAVDDVIVMSEIEPTDGRYYYEAEDSLGSKLYMYSVLQIDSIKLDRYRRLMRPMLVG